MPASSSLVLPGLRWSMSISAQTMPSGRAWMVSSLTVVIILPVAKSRIVTRHPRSGTSPPSLAGHSMTTVPAYSPGGSAI